MKIIGITGGVGAGKSQVLDYVKETYGAYVCQADQVAKNQQKRGTTGYHAMVTHFGTNILTEEGQLNRKKLAEIVFFNEKERDALNQIIHPIVKAKIQSLVHREKKKHTKWFFLEAALLLEEHYDEICDEIWYIHTSEEIRKKRLQQSRGYNQNKIEAIMKAQLSKEDFLSGSDRAIDNSKTFEETRIQIADIMKEMIETT